MTKQVDLFTAEEHLVLARWLRQKPLERPDAAVDIDDIVAGWGFDCASDVYASIDAAVASIVLERIQDRLPNYYLRIGENYDDPEIWRGRNIAERKAIRKIELTPQRMFTVNWGGGPGYDWPVEYSVTWIPMYNRFIVTASADCDEANGACDFALGQFEFTGSVAAEAAKSIEQDWSRQRDMWSQGRWVALFGSGLVSEEQAEEMADRVWAEEEDEEELDDVALI
jgi:hypothetical protein